jgi:hypothetical protein
MIAAATMLIAISVFLAVVMIRSNQTTVVASGISATTLLGRAASCSSSGDRELARPRIARGWGHDGDTRGTPDGAKQAETAGGLLWIR